MQLKQFEAIMDEIRNHLPEEKLAKVQSMLEDHVEAEENDQASAEAGHVEDSAIRVGGSSAVRDVQAYNRALQECEPLVGRIPVTCDSAASVYCTTLTRLGHPTKSTNLATLRQMIGLARNAVDNTRNISVPVAMDSASTKRIAKQSPGLARFLEAK